MVILPNEIWKHIGLQYSENNVLLPRVYATLSLVNSKFVIDISTLQEYYIQRNVDSHHTIQYTLPNGNWHSPRDLPALIYKSGTQFWYKNGAKHRDGDLPAVIHYDGKQEWYRNGERHRDNDLPAIIFLNSNSNGNGNSNVAVWYKNGKRHRDGGPALVGNSGKSEWYKNGNLHRDGGPAITRSDGSCEYHVSFTYIISDIYKNYCR